MAVALRGLARETEENLNLHRVYLACKLGNFLADTYKRREVIYFFFFLIWDVLKHLLDYVEYDLFFPYS